MTVFDDMKNGWVQKGPNHEQLFAGLRYRREQCHWVNFAFQTVKADVKVFGQVMGIESSGEDYSDQDWYFVTFMVHEYQYKGEPRMNCAPTACRLYYSPKLRSGEFMNFSKDEPLRVAGLYVLRGTEQVGRLAPS